MVILVFLFLLVAVAITFVLKNTCRSRNRRKLLEDAKCLSTWEEVQRQPDRFERIVLTNFGFGSEVWATTGTDDEMDIELRAFKNGVLILPRPDISVLKTFCRSHGLAVTQKLVK
jgi:hypothetical protein